jgi:hypothetical protein
VPWDLHGNVLQICALSLQCWMNSYHFFSTSVQEAKQRAEEDTRTAVQSNQVEADKKLRDREAELTKEILSLRDQVRVGKSHVQSLIARGRFIKTWS